MIGVNLCENTESVYRTKLREAFADAQRRLKALVKECKEAQGLRREIFSGGVGARPCLAVAELVSDYDHCDDRCTAGTWVEIRCGSSPNLGQWDRVKLPQHGRVWLKVFDRGNP